MALIMKKTALFILLLLPFVVAAQVMTPEKLWELGRVGAKGISEDGKYLVYSVTIPDVDGNTYNSETYAVDIKSGEIADIADPASLVRDSNLSSDGKFLLLDDKVQIRDVKSSDLYPKLDKSNAMIYDDLHIRHWDEWDYGMYNHVMI
jgi:hypothetical protein